jgi:hypothetical protein
LETFPTKRLQLGDMFVHVFSVVKTTDDGVDLELDAVLFAPVTDLVKLLDVLAFSTANLDVGSFDEGVAGHSQDVNVRAMPLKEAIPHETTIGGYRHRLQLKVLFAEVNQLAQERRIQERFTASEVDLAHSGSFEHIQPFLRILDGLFVRRTRVAFAEHGYGEASTWWQQSRPLKLLDIWRGT